MDQYRRLELEVAAGKIQAIIADRDESGNKIRRVQVAGRQIVVNSDIEQKHPGLGIGDYLVCFAVDEGGPQHKIIAAAEFERDYSLVLENQVVGAVSSFIGRALGFGASKQQDAGNGEEIQTADLRQVGVGGAAPQGEPSETTASQANGTESDTAQQSGSERVDPPADVAQ